MPRQESQITGLPDHGTFNLNESPVSGAGPPPARQRFIESEGKGCRLEVPGLVGFGFSAEAQRIVATFRIWGSSQKCPGILNPLLVDHPQA